MTDLNEEARLAGALTESDAVDEADRAQSAGLEEYPGGPRADVCRRCGRQERIHPLDFSMCDACRAQGWGSNAAGERLRFLNPEGTHFEVVSSW